MATMVVIFQQTIPKTFGNFLVKLSAFQPQKRLETCLSNCLLSIGTGLDIFLYFFPSFYPPADGEN